MEKEKIRKINSYIEAIVCREDGSRVVYKVEGGRLEQISFDIIIEKLNKEKEKYPHSF